MTDRRFVLRSSLVAACAALLGLTACASGMYGSTTRAPSATGVLLTGNLTGAQEVPPNTRPATGTAEVRFDKDSRVLTYKVTYTGLSGPVTGAHIHGPASPGANAPVVVPFTPGTEGQFSGQATLSAAQAGDLLAGLYYVNVHTAAHPGGEIRAQLRLAP